MKQWIGLYVCVCMMLTDVYTDASRGCTNA